MKKLSGLVALTCTLVGVFCSHAAASSPVIADCNSHGRLTGHYSVAQLHAALSEMPADVQEYTDCYDVIQRQLLAQIPGVRPSRPVSSAQGSGGSFLPAPVIVAIAVLAAAGATLGAVALRRRR